MCVHGGGGRINTVVVLLTAAGCAEIQVVVGVVPHGGIIQESVNFAHMHVTLVKCKYLE